MQEDPNSLSSDSSPRRGIGIRIVSFLICTVMLRNMVVVHFVVFGTLIGSGAITEIEDWEQAILIAAMIGATWGLLVWSTGRLWVGDQGYFANKEVFKAVGTFALWFALVVIFARWIQMSILDWWLPKWEGSWPAATGGMVAGMILGWLLQEWMIRRGQRKALIEDLQSDSELPNAS
jgi:hypothetical protein